MLKKIIAAAAASTLAVSALAATASADTKIVYDRDVVDTVTVTVSGKMEGIAAALGLDFDSDPKNVNKLDKQNFSEISYEVFPELATTKAKQEFTGGKISVEIAGLKTITDKVENKDGKPTIKEGKPADDKLNGEATVEAGTIKYNKTIKGKVEPKFAKELGDLKRLDVNTPIDSSKTSATVELTMVLNKAQFDALLGSANDPTQVWQTENIGTTKLDKAVFTEDFEELIDDKAVKADSSKVNVKLKAKGDGATAVAFIPKDGWSVTSIDVKTKKSLGNVKGTNCISLYGVNDDADAWSRADMRDFINGGKAIFKFNRAITDKEWVDGVVRYDNSNAQNAILKTDYTEGSDTLTVDFPANFTYSANSNEYPRVTMDWTFDVKDVESLDDLELMSVTFVANEKAPDNSGNNGGLVEDDKNKPSTDDKNSSDTKPSTSDNTNSGSTSNDNKNPSTGVAMAVAPVALAAAAAAVVISKKRK